VEMASNRAAARAMGVRRYIWTPHGDYVRVRKRFTPGLRSGSASVRVCK